MPDNNPEYPQEAVGIATEMKPHYLRDLLFFGGFALFRFCLNAFTATGYGYFRDELYYLDCARHLDWGYVDHPPLSIAVLKLFTLLFGEGLFAIRLPVMLAGAATVFLTGWLAREMGGGRFAQALACLCAVFAPVLLAMGTFFSMNAFDHLFWTLAVLVLVRLINSGDTRWWLVFGFIAGLGLLNKISLLFLGFAVVAAMILTPYRREFVKWPLWVGGVIALLLFLPHLAWQAWHGWPTLEFTKNAALYKNAPQGPMGFFLSQLLLAGPLAAPVWLAGIGYGLFARGGKKYRWLSLVFVCVFLLLSLTYGKDYYLGAAFPMIFALGGVAWERGTRNHRWVRTVYAVLLVVSSLALLPYVLPVLPVPRLLAYLNFVGIAPPQQERSALGALPQHFADRFGWRELADVVAQAYYTLPEADRDQCCVLVSNYGEAGALNLFGAPLGLPPVLCGHNNYFLWGPGACTGEVLLVYHFSREDLLPYFGEVSEVARYEHPHVMPYQNDLPLYLCRKPKKPLREVWPELKRFI